MRSTHILQKENILVYAYNNTFQTVDTFEVETTINNVSYQLKANVLDLI